MGETGLVTHCDAQMDDLNQNNNKNILWQKTQKTQQSKQGLIEQNTSCELKAVKAVEVLPLMTP